MQLHPSAVKEETGFSAIEMLLCLIIAIMITFVGYYVYSTQKSATETYNAASKTAQAVAPKTIKRSPTVTPNSLNYLVIKEWGVKFPLSETIKDAVYVVDAHSDTSQMMDLSTQKLANTSCSASGNAPSGLYRFSSDSKSKYYDQQSVATIMDQSVKVGDYYFAFIHAQAACSDDAAVQAQASANATSFREAIKSLQAQ